MSYNPFFTVKAQNSNIATFSSTADETFILLIANDVNQVLEDGETVKNNDNSNAVIIGANVIDDTTDDHEAFISVRDDNVNAVIARFNSKNILFKVDAVFDNDILPSSCNITSNIGSELNKWGNIYASNIIADGSYIKNINLNDKTTDDLKETLNNRYYKLNHFRKDFNNRFEKLYNDDLISLDNIPQGNINKNIQNGYYKGTLVVDDIIINNYNPNNDGFSINYDINVTNTDQIYEGSSNLYYTEERVSNIVINQSSILIDYIKEHSNIILDTININDKHHSNLVNSNFELLNSNIHIIKNLNIDYTDETAVILNSSIEKLKNETQFGFNYFRNDLIIASNNILNNVEKLNISNLSNIYYFKNDIINEVDIIKSSNIEFDSTVELLETKIDIELPALNNSLKKFNSERISNSNEIINYINLNIKNTSNYNSNLDIYSSNLIDITSNYLFNYYSNLDLDTSNLIDTTSNYLFNYYSNLDLDTSNLIYTTSNYLFNYSSNLDLDTSNLIYRTCNYLFNYSSNLNLDTSNLIDTTSNYLFTYFKNIDIKTSNIIKNTHHYLFNYSSNLDYNTSNIIKNTHHYLFNYSSNLDLNTSNLIDITSNYLFNFSSNLDYDTSNLIDITANYLFNYSSNLDYDTSNLINTTSNYLFNNSSNLDLNTSNLIDITSNYLFNYSSNLDYNTSNLIDITSNYLFNYSSNLDYNTSNFIDITANYLFNYSSNLDYDTSNLIDTTSNYLFNYSSNLDLDTSNLIDTTSNYLKHYINYIDDKITLDYTERFNNIITGFDTVISIMNLNFSNYIDESSNYNKNYSSNLDYNTSNFIDITCNYLFNIIDVIDTDVNTKLSLIESINNQTTEIVTKLNNDVDNNSNIIVDNYIHFSNLDLISSNLTSNLNINISNYLIENEKEIIRTSNLIDITSNFIYTYSSNLDIRTSNLTSNLNINISNYLIENEKEIIRTSNLIDITSNFLYIYSSNLDIKTSNLTSNLNINISNYLIKNESEIYRTSNLISFLDDNTSNYFRENEFEILRTSNLMSNLNINISNYLIENELEILRTSNLTSNLNINVSNYLIENELEILRTSNLIKQLDDNTSNYFIENELEILRSSNFIKDTSNHLFNYSTNLNINNSNYIDDVNSNVLISYTDNSNYIGNNNNNISNYINNIESKTSNIEILTNGDIKLNSDLTIIGELTVSDLNVTGLSTKINTTTYQTENLEIINNQGDGPSFKILHNDVTHNIFETSNADNNFFIIDNNNKIGINKTPVYELDVNGTVSIDNDLIVNNIARLSNIEVEGNIIPLTDKEYNIGDLNNRWKSIYLSGNTIHLGNLLISTETGDMSLKTNDNNNAGINVSDLNILSENGTTATLRFNGNNLEIKGQDSNGNIINTTQKIKGDLIVEGILTLEGGYVIEADLVVNNNITFNGNINDISSTELNYLKNTSKNIEENFISTSNHIGDLDTNFSNLIIDNSNYLYYNSSNLNINISNYLIENEKEIIRTSNLTSNLNINISNYLIQNELEIIRTSNLTSNLNINLSNYLIQNELEIIRTSNLTSNLNINLSNYLIQNESEIYKTSNLISLLDDNTSNYFRKNELEIYRISNLVNELDDNTSNYFRENELEIIRTSNLTSNLNINLSNYLIENESEIYRTSNLINELDNNTSNYIKNIESKTSNIEILSNGNIKLNSDLNIQGELTVTDLNVTGLSTQINTTIYQTENLEIINNQGDGPSLKIDHNNQNNNIIELLNNTKTFIVNKNGNLGINKTPTAELDINGDIKFSGLINNISANQFNYLDGTSKNIETNFNATSNHIGNLDINISNHIFDTSNYVTYSSFNISNYIKNNESHILNTSNHIGNLDTNISNYIINNESDILNTSNHINDLDIKFLNLINYDNNLLNFKLLHSNNNISNYINNNESKTSNIELLTDGNIKLNSDLTIDGILYVSNIDITGETVLINTTTYQTENLEIINNQADGPSLKIDHNNQNNNIVELINNTKRFIIDKNGNLGINKTPTVELDINGDIKFIGSINNITANELHYLEGIESSVQDQLNILKINSNINSNKLINLEYNSNINNYKIELLQNFSNITSNNIVNHDNRIKVIEEYNNNQNLGNLINNEVLTNTIPSIVSDGLLWNNSTNKLINTITQYTDTNVNNVLSTKKYLTINNIPLDDSTLHVIDGKLKVIDSNIISYNNEGVNIKIDDNNGIKQINVGEKQDINYITNSVIFTFQPYIQTFDIPNGVNEVVAYVWGAGGGGGGYINGGCGGSGGFTSGTINVSDISKLYIHVGGGGDGNVYSTFAGSGYQYGGIGGVGSGAGGGKSGIYFSSYENGNEILIAGGGGGAGGTNIPNSFCNGGGGGGIEGNNGSILGTTTPIENAFTNAIGRGGRFTNGGIGGIADTNGNDGIRAEGGDAKIINGTIRGQGGGGAGYWGGGSGGNSINFGVGPGGGGSGYLNNGYLKNGIILSSETVVTGDIPINPPKSENEYYISSVGKGGINNGGNGGDGLIVIIYKTNNTTATLTENSNYRLPFQDLSIPNNDNIEFVSGLLKFENDKWIVTNELDERIQFVENKTFETLNLINLIKDLSNIDFTDVLNSIENIDTLNTNVSNYVDINIVNSSNYTNSLLTKINNLQTNIDAIEIIQNIESGQFSNYVVNVSNYLENNIITNQNDIIDIRTKINFIDNVNTTTNRLYNDIIIDGELTVTNLNVTGLSTQINTTTYQTENLEIINNQGDGPSLKIDHNNQNNNIIELVNNTKSFIVNKDGNLGINKIPTSELDINGDIKFTGLINNISTNELNYLDGTSKNIETNFNTTSNHIGELDNNTSNYFRLNETEIYKTSNLISLLDDNTSNYFKENESEIYRTSNLIGLLDNNTSNYFKESEVEIYRTSNLISRLDDNTSNYFKESEVKIYRTSNLISQLDDNTSNYFKENESEIYRTSNLTSNLNINISNYLIKNEYEIYRTSNLISLLDDNTSNSIKNIESKTSNIEILSNGNIKLNSDLTISGELTVTDLNVTGLSTQINTSTYQTENLEIINNQGDGPSLKIDHNNQNNNIIELVNNTKSFIVNKDGNLGINKIPTSELDINGDIKFTGLINNISTNELNYLDGTSKNIETNFNVTSNHISILDTNISNYIIKNESEIYRTSNLIGLLNDNTSNYFTENELEIYRTSNLIDLLDDNTSNYFKENESEIYRTSNLIGLLDENTSNYLKENELEIYRTSNLIGLLNENTSNYFKENELEIYRTSNLIGLLDENTSNYFKENELEIYRTYNLISLLDDNTSNYFKENESEIYRTSNLIGLLDDNTSNYFKENELEILNISNHLNNIYSEIENTSINVILENNNTSNYIENISNILLNFITSNTLNDITRSNLFINSNIIITTYVNNTSNNIIDLIQLNNDNTIDYINNIDTQLETSIQLTSNEIIEYINAGSFEGNGINVSNYILDSSNEIIEYINAGSFEGNGINVSNYILDSSNEIIEYINAGSFGGDGINVSNYILDSSNEIIKYIENKTIDNDINILLLYDTSNLLTNEIKILKNSSNSHNTRLDAIEDNLDDLLNSNLSISNLIDLDIININLDSIEQGSNKKFIVDNEYNNSLTVKGTLNADNTILNNNATIVNSSIYNSGCVNIVNYGVNHAIKIDQIGDGDILNVQNNYDNILKITSNGYIGNKNDINYNIDIEGYINATKLRGDGSEIKNINLSDKSTSYLEEGSNLYYTEERLYDFYQNSNLLLSNLQFTEILQNVQEIKHVMGLHQLDRVEQGTSNKYIVNNIYNDDLVVLGHITAKSINILELDTEYYTDLYYSNLFINPFNDERDTYANISNILRNVIIDEPTIGNNSNLENRITDIIDYGMSNYMDIINKLFNDKINNLTLDDIQQGNINKYIISNIYNENLVVNGNIITKLIDINIEEELFENYSNIYNYGLSNAIAGNSEYLEDRIDSIVDNNMSNYFRLIDEYVDNKIKTISLDNIIQGEINKFIIKNVYNDDLIVNGEIITKNVDISIDDNLSTLYSNLYINEIINHNIAESEYLSTRISEGVDENISNYTLIFDNELNNINANISNYIVNVNNEILNKIGNLTLDNIYQGEKNKYIVNDIYNNNLVVNGNIITKLIDINIEDELCENYSNIYNETLINSNIDTNDTSLTLHENYIKLSKYITNQTTVINNNINDIYNIITQYHPDEMSSNQQIVEINSLNMKLDNLTNKYNKIEQILVNLGYDISEL